MSAAALKAAAWTEHRMQTGSLPLPRSRQRGYSYLLILFTVAALGFGIAQAGVVWQQAALRAREAELLYRGADIARAIARYRATSPAGSPAWPQALTDLVEDKRWPMPVRHLRRIWRDPLTGAADWVLVRAGGGIVGVHSRSETVPIRTHDLPPELSTGAVEARTHADWVFRPAETPADAQAVPAADTNEGGER